MVGLPDGEKNWRYVYSFSHDPRTWRTHRRIDTAWRQRLRLMLASRDNKRLRTSYHFVEANYWRTQSIARPLCNSRATCHWLGLPVCIKLSRRVLYGLCVVRRDRRQTDHLIIYECRHASYYNDIQCCSTAISQSCQLQWGFFLVYNRYTIHVTI